MVLTAKLTSPAVELLSELHLLQSSLPCDIHLVNLRTIQSKVNSNVCLNTVASFSLYLVQGVGKGKEVQEALEQLLSNCPAEDLSSVSSAQVE